MGFTRLLRNLARDKQIGPRVVPIIPDEARTFGMDALFRELKIYAALGQKYEPVDHDLLLSYTESNNGQILEEGITEAGSMASFIAAGTSYAHRGVPMVPFYTFYSMFGFQRVGDLIWQAADARTRGFLLGATAGRTTLLGEGLQHQDGHSLVLASTVPAVPGLRPGVRLRGGGHRAGRPAADVRSRHRPRRARRLLLPHALQRELRDAADAGGRRRRRSRPAIVEGLYRWQDAPDGPSHRATILFSGSAQGAARRGGRPSWPSTSTSASSCGRRRATSACARTRSPPSGGTACTPTSRPGTPRVAELLAESAGPDRRRHRLHGDACPTRSPASCPGGRSCRSAPTAWAARTPARRCAGSSRSTPATSSSATLAALAAAGRRQAGGRHRRDGPLRHRPRRRRPVPVYELDCPANRLWRQGAEAVTAGRPHGGCPVADLIVKPGDGRPNALRKSQVDTRPSPAVPCSTTRFAPDAVVAASRVALGPRRRQGAEPVAGRQRGASSVRVHW